MSVRRTLLSAAVLPVLVLTACGGGDGGKSAAARPTVPAGAVAVIDGHRIGAAAYDRSLQFQRFDASSRVQATPLLSERTPPKLLTLKAPYDDCFARASKRAGDYTPEQVRSTCGLLARLARSGALQGLLQDVSMPAEARRLGVTVTTASVDKSWKPYLKTTLGASDAATLRRFSTVTGLPESELRAQLRRQLLQAAVESAAVARALPKKIPDAELRASYATHKSSYSFPASRDIRYLRTKTARQARAARAAVQAGMPFATAVRKYSNDAATRKTGGKVEDVSKPVKYAALEKAVFETAKGELSAPAKTKLGYYVVRVEKLNPPRTLTFEESRPGVTQAVMQAKKEAALARYKADAIRRWSAKTVCAPGVSADYCKAS